MGNGGPAGAFIGGMLGEIGKGLMARAERHNRINEKVGNATLDILSGMVTDPSFSGDPAARQDILNTYFSTLEQMQGGGFNKKGLAQAKDAVGQIIGRVYPSGQGRPEMRVESTLPPVPGGEAPIPQPTQALPGIAERRGPFLTPDELQQRKLSYAREMAGINTESAINRAGGVAEVQAPWKQNNVPGLVTSQDPELQAWAARMGRTLKKGNYRITRNGRNEIIQAWESPDDANEPGNRGVAGQLQWAYGVMANPMSTLPERQAAASIINRQNIGQVNQETNYRVNEGLAAGTGIQVPKYTPVAAGGEGLPGGVPLPNSSVANAAGPAAGPGPSASPGPKAPAYLQGMITTTAQKYGVPPQLALAVAHVESRFDPNATGTKGDGGLFQLMPGTAQDMGVQDVYNPEQNIEGGIKYLKILLDRYNGDQQKALMAYNGGMRNVDRGTVSTAAQAYPGKVQAAMGQPASAPGTGNGVSTDPIKDMSGIIPGAVGQAFNTGDEQSINEYILTTLGKLQAGRDKFARLRMMRGANLLMQKTGLPVTKLNAEIEYKKDTALALRDAVQRMGAYDRLQRTILAHGELMKQARENVDGTGVPVLDRWIQAGMKSIAGDEDVARLDVAVNAVAREYANAISNGFQSRAMLPVRSGEEAKEAIAAYMNKGQISAILDQLNQEVGVEGKAMAEQQRELYDTLAAPIGSGVNVPEVNPTNTPLPRPPKPGARIDTRTIQVFMQIAGGDKQKAAKLAQGVGWDISKPSQPAQPAQPAQAPASPVAKGQGNGQPKRNGV